VYRDGYGADDPVRPSPDFQTIQLINTPCFIKKTVPFVILLYLYFYKAEFHENPPAYTGGIGHYEHTVK